MIDRDGAVRLVEDLLRAEERQFAERGQPVTLAISKVTEHRLGWIISSQSEAYLRSGNVSDMLVGGGPYLVDRHDRSIHHIPITDYVGGLWEEDYEQRIKPTEAADADPHRGIPFATEVREALAQEGRVTAIRLLRRCAPSLNMTQASVYVTVVGNGECPPTELIELARPPQPFSPRLGIRTIAGPCES
ncbi:YrhB domain-containing protein [Actinoallomurus sp. CA-150999]|uniref:YrhB domain-containing protein n=1 Tax=Actinoallomurus sp. CA-150999 TaxID=3239887 RepID=UPI003D8EC6FD